MLGPPLRPAHRLEEEPDLGGVLGKVGDGWKMDEQEGHRNQRGAQRGENEAHREPDYRSSPPRAGPERDAILCDEELIAESNTLRGEPTSDERPRKVVVVVPFLDEEENLPVLYERLSAAMAGRPEQLEVLFVDDGSSDSSPAWAAEKARVDRRVKLLRLSRNFGHQVAITAGLDHAEGDAVVIMDADLQDPPELVPELVAKWREGYEVIYAIRTARSGESFLKKALASAFYRVFRSMVNFEVPRNVGDFWLLDSRVVQALRNVREQHRYVRGITSWVGFRQAAVPYHRATRHAGRTKYPFWRSLNLAFDAITSFSGAPLRWMMGLGFLISVGGGLLAARVVIDRFRFPDRLVAGWASLMAITLLLSGTQLLCVGLLGQYVSRIFEEVKKRPLYFVRERVGLPGGQHVGSEPERG
jgi:polyisoprenyl-phosphate glycosyltransferase